MPYDLVSPFEPAGDQPRAIRELTAGLARDDRYQTLLGVTGSVKTMTMAHVIARFRRPTLVLSHNKTLAAPLYRELQSLFRKNDLSPPYRWAARGVLWDSPSVGRLDPAMNWAMVSVLP